MQGQNNKIKKSDTKRQRVYQMHMNEINEEHEMHIHEKDYFIDCFQCNRLQEREHMRKAMLYAKRADEIVTDLIFLAEIDNAIDNSDDSDSE